MRRERGRATPKMYPLAWLLLLTGIESFAAEARYTIQPIETSFLGPYAWVRDVNPAGALAGAYGSGPFWDAPHQAMLFTAANGLDLLGILGTRDSGATNSDAYFVNASGQVVGESQIDDQSYTHGFLWSRQTGMVDIGTLGGTKTAVRGLNDSGQVVGSSDSAGRPVWADPDRAFLYTPGDGIKDLGTLGGETAGAFAINNKGWVTGDSETQDRERHAFRYKDGTGMEDLGDLPFGAGAVGQAINDYGIVAGYGACDISTDEAILATGSHPVIELGRLYGDCSGPFHSYARALNNRNTVVGDSAVYGEGSLTFHSFVWSWQRGMEDLNELIADKNSEIQNASKIDDNGCILALADESDGQSHLVFLNPIPPRLGMNSSKTNATVSWTPYWPDYVLEQADTLASTNWIAVPNVSTNSVQISLSSSTRFFRLRRLSNDEVQDQFNRWLSSH